MFVLSFWFWLFGLSQKIFSCLASGFALGGKLRGKWVVGFVSLGLPRWPRFRCLRFGTASTNMLSACVCVCVFFVGLSRRTAC